MCPSFTEFVFFDVSTAAFPKTFEHLPSHYPRKTVPLNAISDNTTQIKRGPHLVKINVKQIPNFPAFSETNFKLQGVTCETTMTYILQESEKNQYFPLLDPFQGMKNERYIFVQETNGKDFHYFKPPKKAL